MHVLQDLAKNSSLLKLNNFIFSLSAFTWGDSTWVLARFGAEEGKGKGNQPCLPVPRQRAPAARCGKNGRPRPTWRELAGPWMGEMLHS